MGHTPPAPSSRHDMPPQVNMSNSWDNKCAPRLITSLLLSAPPGPWNNHRQPHRMRKAHKRDGFSISSPRLVKCVHYRSELAMMIGLQSCVIPSHGESAGNVSSFGPSLSIQVLLAIDILSRGMLKYIDVGASRVHAQPVGLVDLRPVKVHAWGS